MRFRQGRMCYQDGEKCNGSSGSKECAGRCDAHYPREDSNL